MNNFERDVSAYFENKRLKRENAELQVELQKEMNEGNQLRAEQGRLARFLLNSIAWSNLPKLVFKSQRIEDYLSALADFERDPERDLGGQAR